MNSGKHIVHKAISDYVAVYIRDANSHILGGLTNREHAFYTKQLEPCITKIIAATADSTKTIITPITTCTDKLADLTAKHKRMYQSIEQIIA